MVFSRTRLAWLPAGAALLLGGCEGCEPELVEIAPTIAVDVCRDPQVMLGEKLAGGVRDCDVELGTKDISVRNEIEIQVSNPSAVELTIESASFTSDSDVAFELIHKSDTVAPGLTSVWIVGFRPMVESDVSGTLVIKSDAQNLADGEDVIIHFTGTGVDNGVPDIEVSPVECDFGRVAKDSAAICNVTITNNGQRELVFDEVVINEQAVPPESALAETGAFGFVGRPPVRDDAIPAAAAGQNTATLGVRFIPDVLGNYQGKLVLRTNDPDEPEIVVPLSGIGVDPPTCGIEILSVNGVPAGNGPTIEPLDDVVLTAAPSMPATPDGSIDTVEWEILSVPPGSQVIPSNTTGETFGFTFAGGVAGVDIAGRYRVRATVYDDLGTQSVNQCELEFEAVPTDTILTQLTWDTGFGDMDLHLVKMNDQGQFCGNPGVDLGPLAESCDPAQVCFYANRNPDWDGDGTSPSDGDPSLDIDDLCGFGPENINIDIAEPGSYLVGVDFFGFTGCSGSGPVGNTLRIYLYGQLQAEFYVELVSGDWWEVAVIHWPGEAGVPCIEDLSTDDLECPDY